MGTVNEKLNGIRFREALCKIDPEWENGCDIFNEEMISKLEIIFNYHPGITNYVDYDAIEQLAQLFYYGGKYVIHDMYVTAKMYYEFQLKNEIKNEISREMSELQSKYIQADTESREISESLEEIHESISNYESEV